MLAHKQTYPGEEILISDVLLLLQTNKTKLLQLRDVS